MKKTDASLHVPYWLLPGRAKTLGRWFQNLPNCGMTFPLVFTTGHASAWRTVRSRLIELHGFTRDLARALGRKQGGHRYRALAVLGKTG